MLPRSVATRRPNVSIVGRRAGRKALFRYTRLPFGVASTPGIFQRVMEKVLQGIPNVVVYLDDILAASALGEKHVNLLGAIMSWVQAAGLHLRKSKYAFEVDAVTYP